MASLTEESRKQFYETLISLKPLEPDNHSIFNINCPGLEVSFEASSMKEAATKFGHGLFQFNQLDSTTKEKPFTFECENVGICEKVEYQAFVILKGTIKIPLIVAKRILKRGNNCSTNHQNDSVAIADEEMIAADTVTGDTLDHDIGNNLDEVVVNTLHHYFGYPNFKPLQKEIIKATLSGRNALGILGTGGGKSLTFLLPAVLSSYPTVVVAPTKSLIDDILVRCQDLNISTCKFTGSVPKEMQNVQLENFNSFKIILTTPEMIEGDLLDKMEHSKIERIVFDEAHTISTWGNTFRPVYKAVCEQVSRLDCPKLLLSATVPSDRVQELNNIFGDFIVIRDSVFRDNLVLAIEERSSGSKFYDQLSVYIQEHEGCGIVYCVFSSDVTKIHSEMIKRGTNCTLYHGQLAENVKVENVRKWNTGEVNVMIANSAFGMGIDKSNVRYVVHARLPTAIDEYYQQCGRAGRDGQAAVCCMFYNHTDKTALLKMFRQHDQFEQQRKQLNDLIIFLEDLVQCRHKNIMSHYGEERDGFMCGTSCDNCQNHGNYAITDGTSDALKVVQAVVQLTGKKISLHMLKLYLAGSNQKCIQKNNLDTFSTFGSLSKKFVPVVLLQKFLHLLIHYDVLVERVTLSRNSISIVVDLGPNAHKLIDYNYYVPKYEKL